MLNCLHTAHHLLSLDLVLPAAVRSCVSSLDVKAAWSPRSCFAFYHSALTDHGAIVQIFPSRKNIFQVFLHHMSSQYSQESVNLA